MKSRTIHCSWCGNVIQPKAARIRMFESDSIRVSGNWLAHFHPDCGDRVLDMCERLMAARTVAGSAGKDMGDG
jgi:hypothetical protein